jgi:hypothetical protein
VIVAPNLLQPRTQIDHMVEDTPLAFFSERRKPEHHWFERAEIQCEEKPGYRRHSNCQ